MTELERILRIGIALGVPLDEIEQLLQELSQPFTHAWVETVYAVRVELAETLSKITVGQRLAALAGLTDINRQCPSCGAMQCLCHEIAIKAKTDNLPTDLF